MTINDARQTWDTCCIYGSCSLMKVAGTEDVVCNSKLHVMCFWKLEAWFLHTPQTSASWAIRKPLWMHALQLGSYKGWALGPWSLGHEPQRYTVRWGSSTHHTSIAQRHKSWQEHGERVWEKHICVMCLRFLRWKPRPNFKKFRLGDAKAMGKRS